MNGKTSEIASKINGGALMYAMGIFNALTEHDEFFGNDYSKEYVKRIIEIDQKTSLFKDGQYVFAMMIVSQKLKYEHLMALAMFDKGKLAQVNQGLNKIIAVWDELIGGVEECIKLIDAKVS